MRYIIALLFGTALVHAAAPQFPAAAFFWDATHVAIVLGKSSIETPQNATKMLDRKLHPPFGDEFALFEVNNSNGVKSGETFDINLTGSFWVRATVDSFIYNKTQYSQWMLATAVIHADDQGRYADAVHAKLSVFLAEPANPQRLSDTGQIRNPVVKSELSASARAALEANLNKIMRSKLHEAIRKKQSAAPDNLVAPLLGGKAKLTMDVDQVDLGRSFGARQHVSGTWMISGKAVFSIQGWKPPDSDRIESVEAVDGMREDKAEIIDAIGDWAEESLNDLTIENVFVGGRLLRHSAGYENSSIYLERTTSKGQEFERTLYGL